MTDRRDDRPPPFPDGRTARAPRDARETREALRALRRTEPLPAPVADAIMARVRAEARAETPSAATPSAATSRAATSGAATSGAAPRGRWVPGRVALRAASLLVAAGVGGAVLVARRPASREVASSRASTDHTRSSGTRLVRFQFAAADVRRVTLAGDFNRWDPSALALTRDRATGVWSVSVALPSGRYAYAFVVDGRDWVADPSAPLVPDDGFGRPSSVVVIAAEETRS